MSQKYIGIFVFLLLSLTPFYFTFAQTSNAGFIPENIWYSKDPFEEGDKIKIFTLIYNPDSKQLSGIVFFFDKTTFLGSKNFSVAGKGVQDLSIDWTVSSGDHVIFAQIQSAKYLMADKTYKEISLSETKTSESNRSVSKKIIPGTSGDNTNSQTEINNMSAISNIQNFVKENTPEVVSKTIEISITGTEKFRQNLGNLSETKKEALKKEVKLLEDTKKDNSSEKNNAFLKPFKYVEIFFMSLISTIFNNKYIFYGLILVVIFIILRFVFRKIF